MRRPVVALLREDGRALTVVKPAAPPCAVSTWGILVVDGRLDARQVRDRRFARHRDHATDGTAVLAHRAAVDVD